MRKVLILVALILGVNGAWANCNTITQNLSGLNYCETRVVGPSQSCIPNGIQSVGAISCGCSDNSGRINVQVNCQGGSRYYAGGAVTSANCSTSGNRGSYSAVLTYTLCDTQCDSDSLACINEGGIWAANPNASCGKSCMTNACTSEDTTFLEGQKARCDSLGGTNDFGLSNNGDRCDLTGFCNLCNGTAFKKLQKEQRKNCCETGHAPDTSKIQCVVEDITSGEKVYKVSGQNSCLSGDPQIIITPTGESYREGCDDPPPENTSSNSGGTSSSDGAFSSSSESGGDSLELEWLKDSTHKIIMYDSTTAANSIDLVNYLYDIKTCLEAGTCGGGAPIDYTGEIQETRDTLHHSNELLKQIADKDFSVQVNGGLTAEKQAELIANIGNVADSTAKYGMANGERLDSIISALKGIGADSVAHGLDSVRNEYIREGIDSLYSLRTGLDSTFADWSDTSGAAAGGDTTGKGGELDALGDSLAAAIWAAPCDTSGGKPCNDAYIGANGIKNATTSWKGAADAIGDTLNSGAVKDSVDSWADKLVNNGVLSGNGSATCPAVFQRTWNIPLGPSGTSYAFGPFSKIVCNDFFGGITFWALARIVLRAMVAITCMWWLYRAVTGTDNSGESDDD